VPSLPRKPGEPNLTASPASTCRASVTGRATAILDGSGAWRGAGRRVGAGGQPRCAMPRVVEHADAMQRARSIRSDKKSKLLIHRFTSLVQRATATLRQPLYWRSRRRPSTGRSSRPFCRGHMSYGGARSTGCAMVAPGGSAGSPGLRRDRFTNAEKGTGCANRGRAYWSRASSPERALTCSRPAVETSSWRIRTYATSSARSKRPAS
jgi:hypothetical protein